MTNVKRWTHLDSLVADQGPLTLPHAVYTELAERLREAAGDKDPTQIRALAAQLEDLLVQASAVAEPEARRAAWRDAASRSTAIGHAFDLGQISFAHQFAADIAAKRADAGFEQLLASESLAPYVQALWADDLTGVELAEEVGHRPETVSRNLRKLREMGAVDYRREGTRLINFLTPATRDLAEQAGGRMMRTRLSPPVRAWARSEKREMPEFMRVAPTFAHQPEIVVTEKDATFADA